MPGKRRSRLDRILPEASLDSSPAGGSVPSASPRAPPPSPPHPHPCRVRIRSIPEFPGAGMLLPPPGIHPWLPPAPLIPSRTTALCSFPIFFPTPFIYFRTHHFSSNPPLSRDSKALERGKKQPRPNLRGSGSVLQSAGAPPKSPPAQNPNRGGRPRLTLGVCPRPPAPLSPPAAPRHSCPHIWLGWQTKGRAALELSPLARSVLVA